VPFDVEYDLSKNCAPNFIQKHDILVTIGIQMPKTKHLLTITLKGGPNHVFINIYKLSI